MDFQKITISAWTVLLITTFSVSAKSEVTDDSWNVHGQFTFVDQWHPAFKAPYSGTNSLSPNSNSAQTSDATLMLGRKLWTGAELYLNPEIDQGFGLNSTVGLAGFSSGEAYKVGHQSPYFRFPRYFIRQTFDSGGERIDVPDAPNQMAKSITANNVIVTVGKFSVVDIFDANSYAHDPRSDFLNWTNVDAGAFDYAADAWGFTTGAAVEWTQSWWTLRSGFFALSTIPNGVSIDSSFKQNELVAEFEERHMLNGHVGKFKVLGFVNSDYMGHYNDAVALYQNQGIALGLSAPDTSLVRQYARRSGIALNFEQEIRASLGVFVRASKNGGSKETMAFTDVNQSLSFGASLKGGAWGRSQDTLGAAQIVNNISIDAQRYFSLGGLGPLVGDGQLSYGSERISEFYYNWQATPHVGLALNYQYVLNPAYNRDRGPVNILGFRVHADF